MAPRFASLLTPRRGNGAELPPTVDGESCPTWTAFRPEGRTGRLSSVCQGKVRGGYIAVRRDRTFRLVLGKSLDLRALHMAASRAGGCRQVDAGRGAAQAPGKRKAGAVPKRAVVPGPRRSDEC